MEPQQNSKKTVWLIICGLILIVILFIAGYFAMDSGKSASPIDEQNVEEDVPENIGIPKDIPEETSENVSQSEPSVIPEDIGSIDLGDLGSDIDNLDSGLGNL